MGESVSNHELRPPKVGELYLNTATGRICVVWGWDNFPAYRRVKVQYIDTGVRSRVGLYRWDLSAVPKDALPRYRRMVRVYPGVRVRRLKRTIQEVCSG